VQKTQIPFSDESYSDLDSTKHTLYAGTEVIQSSKYQDKDLLGLVRNTGYLTAKGNIIRETLYPTELNFKFQADSDWFIIIGIILGVVSSIIVIPIMMRDPNNSTKFLIDSVLNLFTVTVPIALPAALSIGLYWAVARLKKSNIFCISPMKINLAAYINTFVFDKTGTLTEQSCSIIGFKPAA